MNYQNTKTRMGVYLKSETKNKIFDFITLLFKIKESIAKQTYCRVCNQIYENDIQWCRNNYPYTQMLCHSLCHTWLNNNEYVDQIHRDIQILQTIDFQTPDTPPNNQKN